WRERWWRSGGRVSWEAPKERKRRTRRGRLGGVGNVRSLRCGSNEEHLPVHTCCAQIGVVVGTEPLDARSRVTPHGSRAAGGRSADRRNVATVGRVH